MSSKLGCYTCSELQLGRPCPSAATDRDTWRTGNGNYEESSGGESEVCSIIVGKSGRIYHQAIVSKKLCGDSRYLTGVSKNIAAQHRDPDAKIKCCSTSGCNFSWTSTGDSQDLSLASNTVLYSIFGVIVFGLFILVFCLVGCFLFWWMKNNSEPNEGENLYFPRSSFGARRKKTEQSYQNPFNSYPGSQQSPPEDSPPGRGRYVGVGDTVRLGERSRRVESEGGRAPKKSHGRPEWQPVYGKNKLAAPAKGSTNAFKFSDSGHISTYM